jgi:hypothetical protein
MPEPLIEGLAPVAVEPEYPATNRDTERPKFFLDAHGVILPPWGLMAMTEAELRAKIRKLMASGELPGSVPRGRSRRRRRLSAQAEGDGMTATTNSKSTEGRRG